MTLLASVYPLDQSIHSAVDAMQALRHHSKQRVRH